MYQLTLLSENVHPLWLGFLRSISRVSAQVIDRSTVSVNGEKLRLINAQDVILFPEQEVYVKWQDGFYLEMQDAQESIPTISTIDTTMHNVNIITRHIERCRNCQEELQEFPGLQAHIDSYITCSKPLTDIDVHRTLYYGYCPIGLDGLTDESGNPIGYYFEEE
jgi:hypothetical protein